MKEDNGLLVIFSKEPEPGLTKTRLISRLGEQGAANLHQRMLVRLLGIAGHSQFKTTEIWADRVGASVRLKHYADEYRVSLREQTGGDLGERMFNAIKSSLKDYTYVVLIGTDCPCIQEHHLNEAKAILENGQDVVLGPTEDGGYYLIGARKIDISLFQGVDWGTAQVADQTRIELNRLGYQWQELEELWDVDVPDDLNRLSGPEYRGLLTG